VAHRIVQLADLPEIARSVTVDTHWSMADAMLVRRIATHVMTVDPIFAITAPAMMDILTAKVNIGGKMVGEILGDSAIHVLEDVADVLMKVRIVAINATSFMTTPTCSEKSLDLVSSIGAALSAGSD